MITTNRAFQFAPAKTRSGEDISPDLTRRICYTFFLLLPVFLLSACSVTPGRLVKGGNAPARIIKTTPATGGGYYKDDGPAEADIDLDAIPDAEPRQEPLHRWANRPYEVLGRKYVPQTQVKAFRQEGIASWYGKKFHGQKTSTGETYDMFAMTAAHPTLPLPSYARVTNPANGRAVVLRVNDRGPFHAERIMDLSYAAAHRLGYINTGSGRVIVETIVPGASLAPVAAQPTPQRDAEELDNLSRQLSEVAAVVRSGSSAEAPERGIFLQLGAFASFENAENLKNHLTRELDWLSDTIHIYQTDNLYRLQLGPYPARVAAEYMAGRIREYLGYMPTIINR
ncbi:MAG: septal ring lytic transglycosylase RlpA family protein [Zoogloeaceae bacterium]|jgi:rare lipoprotein A|nr:septal ring lytic transglycosylase RlpA family protein [Zoogloeaceae bacterium]